MIAYKHFVWDFDGMLFDSYPHTARAAINTLRDFGRDANEKDMYDDLRVSIGYARNKYAFTPEMMERFYQYEHDLKMEPVTMPYPGIPALLARIKNEGGKNYLLTNRDEYAGIYLRKYGMYESFEEIVDTTAGFPSKPDPSGMLYLAEKHRFDGDALMLGDREVDITAGIGGGADGLFFDEFRRVETTKARYIVHTLRELEELLFGVTPDKEENT